MQADRCRQMHSAALRCTQVHSGAIRSPKRHLKFRVARELLHRVRLVRKESLASKEFKDDETEAPHVNSARRAHALGLLAQHGARELGRAVGRRDPHGDRLGGAARILKVDRLPFESKEYKIMRLQVAVHHVLRKCASAHAAAISGDQWRSVAISGDQWRSVALSCTQLHSVALSRTQRHSPGHACAAPRGQSDRR